MSGQASRKVILELAIARGRGKQGVQSFVKTTVFMDFVFIL